MSKGSQRTPPSIPGRAPAPFSWSDHCSYWHFGYPALMVTDTAFFRNPNYHSARDRCETLDYPRLARVTEGLAGAVARLVA